MGNHSAHCPVAACSTGENSRQAPKLASPRHRIAQRSLRRHVHAHPPPLAAPRLADPICCAENHPRTVLPHRRRNRPCRPPQPESYEQVSAQFFSGCGGLSCRGRDQVVLSECWSDEGRESEIRDERAGGMGGATAIFSAVAGYGFHCSTRRTVSRVSLFRVSPMPIQGRGERRSVGSRCGRTAESRLCRGPGSPTVQTGPDYVLREK